MELSPILGDDMPCLSCIKTFNESHAGLKARSMAVCALVPIVMKISGIDINICLTMVLIFVLFVSLSRCISILRYILAPFLSYPHKHRLCPESCIVSWPEAAQCRWLFLYPWQHMQQVCIDPTVCSCLCYKTWGIPIPDMAWTWWNAQACQLEFRKSWCHAAEGLMVSSGIEAVPPRCRCRITICILSYASLS